MDNKMFTHGSDMISYLGKKLRLLIKHSPGF